MKDAAWLQAAVADGAKLIEVSGTIGGSPRVVPAPGVTLRGGRRSLHATGRGSDGVHYYGTGAAPTGLEITSAHGQDVVAVGEIPAP